MTDFSKHLRDISARLPIPEPARSRILLEMATDMEDLLRHYTEGGMPHHEALRSVEEHFRPSDAAIQELIRIHTSPVRRSLEGMSARARRPWERAVLGLVALLVAVGLVSHLVQPGLLSDASLLAWALLAVFTTALAVGVWQALALFGPPARRGSTGSHPALRTLPATAAVLLGTGFVGIWIELFRAALAVRASPPSTLRILVEWLHMALATLVVSLSCALLTGLIWFVLEARAAELDRRAAAQLLGEGHHA